MKFFKRGRLKRLITDRKLDPYFSQIYVYTQETGSELEGVLIQLCREVFPFAVDPIVYKNEDFRKSTRRKKRYDFIEASNFRVELEMFEELPENIEEFREGITKVIIALRTEGRLLVETTLDDEFLIEKTGWTYTKSSPKPPTS